MVAADSTTIYFSSDAESSSSTDDEMHNLNQDVYVRLARFKAGAKTVKYLRKLLKAAKRRRQKRLNELRNVKKVRNILRRRLHKRLVAAERKRVAQAAFLSVVHALA